MLNPVSAEISTIAIPFRFGFRHSLAERAVGDGVLVTVRDAEGRTGHGECTPRDYVSGETSSSVVDALAALLPQWLGRAFGTFDDVVDVLERESAALPRDAHAAWCALELAWLDLGGKVFGRSAGEPLGPVVAPQVTYSGVVSASGKEEALKTCALMKELGVTRAKVKVGADAATDRAVLGAVREALGAAAGIRVDANGAWDAETALARLQEFAELGLEGCEQPCAADDLAGMAWLTARSPVPVIADESLVTAEDAQRLVELGACHVFNVRISKCGGLLGARRVRDIARAAGLRTMLGAHVGETAILAAAGRHFAARTPDVAFAEGSYGKLLLRADVSDALDLGPGGSGAALTGDGLGLDVELERIASYVESRTRVTQSRAERA